MNFIQPERNYIDLTFHFSPSAVFFLFTSACIDTPQDKHRLENILAHVNVFSKPLAHMLTQNNICCCNKCCFFRTCLKKAGSSNTNHTELSGAGHDVLYVVTTIVSVSLRSGVYVQGLKCCQFISELRYQISH